MPPSFAWQTLHGQGWPASTEQERMFVADLRRASGGHVSASTRPSVTVVLNALRCGVAYAELTDLLPALDPAELLGSYQELDAALDAAVASWRRLTRHPSPAASTTLATQAALLLPVPVHRIRLAVTHLHDQAALATAVARIDAEVRRVTSQGHAVAHRLTRFEPGDLRAIQLGRSLHDVAQPGLWSHPYFLPARVGELSSTRVRDLRGEERL